MVKQKNKTCSKKSVIIFTAILFNLLIFFPLITFNLMVRTNQMGNNNKDNNNLEISSAWGWVNLTNDEINNAYFSHNDPLIVKGWLFHDPTKTGYDGYKVSIKIDGQVDTDYNNITANGGIFTINNYTIPANMDIYSPHIVEVEVDTINTITYMNNFIINLYSTSKFYNVIVDKSKPYLRGENIDISGALKYDNNSNIPYANINASWSTDGGTPVTSSMHLTDGSGSMPSSIMVPINPLSINNMTLNLTFSDYPNVGFSYNTSSKILVFDNVIFGGLPLTDGNAGSPYTITGQVISSIAPNFPIFNRIVKVVYNGGQVNKTGLTLANGSFSITFNIPKTHNGSYSYYVELVNSAGRNIVSLNRTITIIPFSSTSGGAGLGALSTPFIEFLIFFIPIVSVIAGGLLIYGYFFLKRQKEEAQVASIPLEGKIKNLKILKDSGRIEESLSYLFNAIYITLIDAKYGRKKKEHETIRDFAIISVKELRMKPSIIYPFITKVEEIIYSRPYEISNDDFYTVIDLFSRVYYELTNYNFILNF